MISPILRLPSSGLVGASRWRNSSKLFSSVGSSRPHPTTVGRYANSQSASCFASAQLRFASTKPETKSSSQSLAQKKTENGSVSLDNKLKIIRLGGQASEGPSSSKKQPEPHQDRNLTGSTSSKSQIPNDLRTYDPSTPLRDSPDLPSKVPTETSSSSFASQMLDLASDLPPPPPPPDQKTGAKSKLTGKRTLSSIEKRRQAIGRVCGSLIIVATGLWVWSLGRDWDNEDEKRILGSGEEGDRLSRARARIFDLFDVRTL